MTAKDQILFIVNKLSAQNAPEILGESGKTISDADRERVAQIVTEIKTLSGDDPSAILAKMMDLKYYIVDKKETKYILLLKNLMVIQDKIQVQFGGNEIKEILDNCLLNK